MSGSFENLLRHKESPESQRPGPLTSESNHQEIEQLLLPRQDAGPSPQPIASTLAPEEPQLSTVRC
jgi:hypothetical protein